MLPQSRLRLQPTPLRLSVKMQETSAQYKEDLLICHIYVFLLGSLDPRPPALLLLLLLLLGKTGETAERKKRPTMQMQPPMSPYRRKHTNDLTEMVSQLRPIHAHTWLRSYVCAFSQRLTNAEPYR